MRFCCGFCQMNNVTVKGPLPRIGESSTQLPKAKYFTRVDMVSEKNQEKIAKKWEHPNLIFAFELGVLE